MAGVLDFSMHEQNDFVNVIISNFLDQHFSLLMMKRVGLETFSKMFAQILVLFFILRLIKQSSNYTPKFVIIV